MRYRKTIDDIDFKMLRKGDKCWIKVVPRIQESTPSTIYLKLNGVIHQWDIYNGIGRDVHKVYFKGDKCVPIFYLKLGDTYYRIDCGYENIKTTRIHENGKNELIVKKEIICNLSQTSCWAISIYSTSEPEKPPFNIM